MTPGQQFGVGKTQIFVLLGAHLSYPDFDVSRILLTDPKLLEKFLYFTEFLRSEWPHAQAPKLLQAMHGDMAGFFEIRIQVAKSNYRFFMRPEPESRAVLIVFAGAAKPRRTGFPRSLYSNVQELWSAFLSTEDREKLLLEILPLEGLGRQQV